MTTRTASGSTYTFGYDYENRLTSVSGAATATFTFDGDGNRVKSVVGATTTYFVGSHYESSGGVITKYYLAGGTRVAMRTGSTFYWLLSDHLGSTSKVATSTGALHSQQLYKAWGESRYTSGTLPTRYTYTGQYSYAGDFGLVFYGSRFYDPLLSRWASPDSIIPQTQGTQAWDRYSYVNNSPVNYTDPTGHWPNISKLLSIGATICDVLATGISITGAIVEAVAAVGGEAFTPAPGVDAAAGFAAGVGFYNQFLNPIENSLGIVSLGLVATADALDHNHELSQTMDPSSGQNTTELLLGADTTYSLTSAIIGNTPLTPDAFTDTAANIATVYYDVSRLMGGEPIWGLWQLRYVKPEATDGHIELIQNNKEEKNDIK